MIYTIIKDEIVVSVWESTYSDLKERYSKFLMEESLKLNIVINPHWHNIMDYDKFHKHYLSLEEFKKLKKDWYNVLKNWRFEKFIELKGDGKKLEFITKHI